MGFKSIAAKRRPPEDAIQQANRSGYMDSNALFYIPIYKFTGTNNWMSVPVMALDDETFHMFTAAKDLVLKDEELKPDKEGKYIINIEALKLDYFYPAIDTPEEFEMPAEVMEARKEKRKLKALAKDAVFVDGIQDPKRYYYVEDGKLRILQGDKEIVADHIEIIYGRKAVNVEALELGHPYLELPDTVAEKFESVLLGKNLALVLEGTSLLSGTGYYKLNMDVPAGMWNRVKEYFEDFGDSGNIKGWLTGYPGTVAGILRIPILD